MLESAQEERVAAAPAPAVRAEGLEGGAGPVRRWSAWPAIALERLRLPYALTVALLGLFALGEQLLEYGIESASLGGPPSYSPLRLIVSPLLVVYILGYTRLLKTGALKALTELRPSIQVSDSEYDDHVRRLVASNPRVELALFAGAAATVLGIFVGMKAVLLNCDSGLPHSLPGALYVLAAYALLGWLLAMVVYSSLRQAHALRVLARRPLVANPFDLKNLLPFGRLSLIQSLPLVGLVLVPLIVFGAPQAAGYLVIGLSALSLLALLVPLWGVHHQIDVAKEQALADINAQLHEIQRTLVSQGATVEMPGLTAMANRTATLMNLRKAIEESPNWPFRDSAALARAIAATTSPLAYFVLNELIRTYLLPLLPGAP